MDEPPRKKCCCLRGCLDRVSNACPILQNRLCEEKKKGKDSGHSFLLQFMIGREVDHVNDHSVRRLTWRYFVPSDGCNGEKVEVCQKAFRRIFGVSERFVREARENQRQQGEHVYIYLVIDGAKFTFR